MRGQPVLFELATGTEARATRLRYIPVLRCQLIKERKEPVYRVTIRTPGDVAAILRSYLEGADREHCVCLLLDAKNAVIGINTVSIGSLTEAIVSPREVFKPAIVAGAVAVILGHNHPSGDTTPSLEDVATTRRLCEAGRLLGIQVLDHIIVGDGETHTSLTERGLCK